MAKKLKSEDKQEGKDVEKKEENNNAPAKKPK
jgi:hypothetical protein